MRGDDEICGSLFSYIDLAPSVTTAAEVVMPLPAPSSPSPAAASEPPTVPAAAPGPDSLPAVLRGVGIPKPRWARRPHCLAAIPRTGLTRAWDRRHRDRRVNHISLTEGMLVSPNP